MLGAVTFWQMDLSLILHNVVGRTKRAMSKLDAIWKILVNY